MDKHCRDCIYHHSAGRRHPGPGLAKYNDWCTKRGGPVIVGWCVTHKAKKTLSEWHAEQMKGLK